MRPSSALGRCWTPIRLCGCAGIGWCSDSIPTGAGTSLRTFGFTRKRRTPIVDNHRTLALLEFPDEADAYLRNRRAGAYGDGEPVVISLNPRVRAYLTQRGLSSEDTPGYFGPEAHARCLRRSADACAWIRERFRFVDDRGLETSYRDSVVWYCRQIVHYCLWGGELLTEAVERRRPSLIVSGAPIVRDLHGHLMHDGERYLGLLAQ